VSGVHCTFVAPGSVEVSDRMRLFMDEPPHIVISNPDTLHYQVSVHFMS
jgi:ATP-dependent helicase YprA (DUF1998 family)